MSGPLPMAAIELGQLLPPERVPEVFRDLTVTGLALDSRRVSAGDLFLAVRGWQDDGRAHIPQALTGNCAAVVAEARGIERFEAECAAVAKAGIPLILMADLQSLVSPIAANFYGHPGRQLDVIGVTGTNGKTTCAMLLARMAHLLGWRAGLIGTLGCGIVADGEADLVDTGMTTPDAVSLQRSLARLRAESVNFVAMEVSSHGLEQGRVSAVGIDCALYTNLSRDHLDYHGSEQRYAEAKARLFTQPGLNQAVINVDDAWGAAILSALPRHLRTVSYGLGATAQVRAENIRAGADGLRFRLCSPWGDAEVESRLLGEFNVYNLLALIATFCLRGTALARVVGLIPRLEPVPGRMEMLVRPGAPRVVVDYAHTPDALEKALHSLRGHCQGRLWCVFGCGGDRDQGKRPQMGAVAESLADRILVTSDNPRREEPQAIIDQILVGMTELKHVRVLADRKEAIDTAIADANEEDCILIAGKGHENYQETGGRRLPFSDLDAASAALDARAARGGAR